MLLILLKRPHKLPPREQQNLKVYAKPPPIPVPYTPLEALALFVNAKMTKFQYNLIRNEAKERQCKIYPSYDKLKKEKQSCYPPRETIQISDISAEVELQTLIDHTVTRIMTIQNSVLDRIHNDENLTIIIKWGCDGSSGHSNYKQKFDDSTTSSSDSELFVISMVPLQLYSISQQ